VKYPINLASEPFRLGRPLFVASVALSAILAAMLVVLVSVAVVERNNAKEARESIASLEAQMAALDGEQMRLTQLLRQPENAQVFEQSIFLNALIARKGISWTRIFSDLEGVLPHNVRVISVRPQVNAINEVQLDLFVGSEATGPVVDMLMKLEASPVFGRTAIVSWLPPSQTEPLYRYRLTVQYAQKL
jgi:type IV pilus assembly protein PilN